MSRPPVLSKIDPPLASRRKLAPFGDRVLLVRAVYHELPDVLAELGLRRVQAVLMDLGLSSLQIDRTERGFAYRSDAPLDMRMSLDDEVTAADIVNTYDAYALSRILRRDRLQFRATWLCPELQRTDGPNRQQHHLCRAGRVCQGRRARCQQLTAGGRPGQLDWQRACGLCARSRRPGAAPAGLWGP